ncbi:MAG: trehalose-6-phosphate synthase [Acidobacteriia bacterium]|nr:trehalose-6-phosphate synthase [Terriglobia bacterium]
MRIKLRLIVSLIVGVTLVALAFAYVQVKEQKQSMRNELEKRAEVLGESLEEIVAPLAGKRSTKELQRIVERFGHRERLAGIAVYASDGGLLAMTSGLDDRLARPPDAVRQALTRDAGRQVFFPLDTDLLHVYALPLHDATSTVGVLAIFHNAGYIDAQTARLWRDTFLRVAIQVLLVVLLALLIVRWSITGPIAKTARWMRELRMNGASQRPTPPPEDLFKPLTQEVTRYVQSLSAARAAAEEEARLREAGEALWTPERLRVHVKNKLESRPLFVISNREPYIHVRRGEGLEAIVPASGLVTALEPILRACDGTWIAHGSGDADHETVDSHGHLRVPPEDPHYTLRRVWLSKEEEEGYYFGFANEGLWPLCHIAHTRPVFRVADWQHYQQVNQKFAKAAVEEMAGVERPVVLVQDYHFALVPRLIKEKRPDARVAIFWHIPWPNAEAFGICPWQRELLEGLLGADLVGFHIQSHCTNFLETVDQVLETRIEWERFAVNRRGHLTSVRPFPISVAFPDPATQPSRPAQGSPYLERAALFKKLGVQATFMGIGVDRVDYTKGILERFRGVERFVERWPVYREHFTLVQIGEPSRTHIKRYHDLLGEVEAEAERINWRFQTGDWKPIVFLMRHHSHAEIEPYYKAADLCMVTSLHDGMNLVAKEYIAARDDEQGALILSRFTGAARELRDAVIVNPYDAEQLAEAIFFALKMDPEERTAKMRRMRRIVREQNIYRWAGDLITELAELRLDTPEPAKGRTA